MTTTPSSAFQAENLINGKFHIAGTAFDNVVAYREGQGAAKLITVLHLLPGLGEGVGQCHLTGFACGDARGDPRHHGSQRGRRRHR